DLLRDMMEKDASDLYLSVNAPPRLSLHGNMVNATEDILTADDTMAYAMALLTEEQKIEFRRELEINVSYMLGEDGRFRVNIFTQRGTTALVIRRINVV